MTEEEMLKNKERFNSLLRSVDRKGIDRVIDYLENHDFYSMPSSLSRHHNWPGGLVQHCLGVHDRLKVTGEKLPLDSLVITSLLHDICKVGKLYRDENGKWRERPDEQLHFKGHGMRSVNLLEKYGLRLSPDERNAIRWHMGGYNLSKDEVRDFFANKKNELWRLLYNADRYNASKGT